MYNPSYSYNTTTQTNTNIAWNNLIYLWYHQRRSISISLIAHALDWTHASGPSTWRRQSKETRNPPSEHCYIRVCIERWISKGAESKLRTLIKETRNERVTRLHKVWEKMLRFCIFIIEKINRSYKSNTIFIWVEIQPFETVQDFKYFLCTLHKSFKILKMFN